MSYSLPNNRGKLFPNKSSGSDYTGEIIVEGVAYFIDAWVNDSDHVGKYLNLRVKKKDKQPSHEDHKLF